MKIIEFNSQTLHLVSRIDIRLSLMISLFSLNFIFCGITIIISGRLTTLESNLIGGIMGTMGLIGMCWLLSMPQQVSCKFDRYLDRIFIDKKYLM
jgi:hypothetical protein